METWSDPKLYAAILTTPPILRQGAGAVNKETFRLIYMQYGCKGLAQSG
jgi:hypothetical protein